VYGCGEGMLILMKKWIREGYFGEREVAAEFRDVDGVGDGAGRGQV